jgi:magnesium transporter
VATPDAVTADAFGGEVERLATLNVPTATALERAGSVRSRMEGESFAVADQVVVLEGSRVTGVLPLRALLAADAAGVVSDLMDEDPPLFEAGAAHEAMAWAMVRHGHSSAVVVDAGGQFRGVIPAHRLLERLLRAYDEDLARLGGYLSSTERARLAAEEPVARRLWHRLPWLVVGLAGAMASAVIVGSFEGQLDQKVLLAFFLPAVVYMADAVGTQTETILIRGFAAGVDLGKVVRREMATGALIGVLIGLCFYPFALLGWADADVALAVGLALFASCSIATLVATVLPRALQRLGTDPAFGSGPLATIVQDLLSISVYLAIAAPIAT